MPFKRTEGRQRRGDGAFTQNENTFLIDGEADAITEKGEGGCCVTIQFLCGRHIGTLYDSPPLSMVTF